MSLKTKIWSLLDVILRVPPVFVMDALLNSNLGFNKINWTESTNKLSTLENIDLKANLNHVTNIDEGNFTFESDGAALTLICCNIFVFLCSLFVFILGLRQLLAVYLWLSAFGVVIWSYIWNDEYSKWVASLATADEPSSLAYQLFTLNRITLLKFGTNYVLQIFLALIFCYANNDHPLHPFFPNRIVEIAFVVPTVLSILPISPQTHSCITLASAGVTFIYILWNALYSVTFVYKTACDAVYWSRSVIRHYGFYTFVENQWVRLHVPQVLRAFWLTRVVEQSLILLADAAHAEYTDHGFVTLTVESLCHVGQQVLIRGCETLVAVLGMTSVISSVGHYVGYLMQSFLLIEDPEDRSIGTVSAILFFILALQTGLTGMEPEKRFLRLYRNLCLLVTALLHFIHNMVNPLLLSLSASRNTSLNKHGRALIVCAFLIAFPCWFLSYLWQVHTISTWLLAVSAFSIEVIIKAIISLLVYLLFMIDAYRNTFWEKLDDYVYYIKATGNTIEFIFGIFLFFNGAWILLFESGGTIRACMMCVHAYFNIWLQAKAGWKVFIKRRSAVNKINSLPEASQEQLQNFDDVCAICYQELTNARITRCNHFFHGVCLRKWLYVQDICPLCHNMLYNPDDHAAGDSGTINVHEHHD